jgi:hypothetical protein
LFFVYLLMWMCVQRWWVWLQGSLDRRIVLKSFFILLYLCLLFFKTCNSAASLSSSNFCVLVAVQFFSDWCNCKSVYTMHSLRGLRTQAWLQASSAGLFFFIKVVNLTCAMHIFKFDWSGIYKVFYFYDLLELAFLLRSCSYIFVVYFNPLSPRN